MQKYNKCQKQYDKDQQTRKYCDKLYRKSLEDNLIDKNETESLFNIFTKILDAPKSEFFYKDELKNHN